MEYVDGLTLGRVIALCQKANVPVPLGVIAEIGRQACEGLHYAHRAADGNGNALGLVHRDVKPSNLILNDQGVVKILDFGISKGALRPERKGSVKGTWGYMSPEQALGQEVRPSADIFGLGIVLYELASRRSMFRGKSQDETRKLLLEEFPAKVAATLDATYSPLVPVLIRALQRDPEARYRDAAEFGRALSSLLPDPITAREEVTRFFAVVGALDRGQSVQGYRAPSSTLGRSVGSVGSVGSRPPSLGDPSPAVVAFSIIGGVFAVLSAFLFFWVVLDASRRPGDVGVTEVGAPATSAASASGAVGQARPDAAMPSAGLASPSASPPSQAEAPSDVRAPPPGSVPLPTRPKPTPAPIEGEAPPLAPRPSTPGREVVNRIESKPAPEPEKEPGGTSDPTRRVAPPAPSSAEAGVGWLTVGSVQTADVYVDGAFVRKVPVVRREVPAGRHVLSIVGADGQRVSVAIEVQAGQEVRRVYDFERRDWRPQ
jgi:hypothetical protein